MGPFAGTGLRGGFEPRAKTCTSGLTAGVTVARQPGLIFATVGFGRAGLALRLGRRGADNLRAG